MYFRNNQKRGKKICMWRNEFGKENKKVLVSIKYYNGKIYILIVLKHPKKALVGIKSKEYGL
jgi:hypothetical protein